MLNLSLNKQALSGVDQNYAWEENEGPDTPNKTSYFGFRVQSAKNDNDSSMRTSLNSNRIEISQNCQRESRTAFNTQTQTIVAEGGDLSNQASEREQAAKKSIIKMQPTKNIKLAEYCQSQNSQRSNKTNATSNNGNRAKGMQIQKRDSSAEVQSQLSKKDGSFRVNNQKTYQPEILSNLMVVQEGDKEKSHKILTEKKLSKKHEYAIQYIQDTKQDEIPLVEDDEPEDFGEFRDLFIQGHALNAEQIEAMDLNLLEISLQNQMNTEENDEDGGDLRRLESFSPELEKLNLEQNFKIPDEIQQQMQQMSPQQEFNFTFNQSENPIKNVSKKKNLMNKVQLFSPQQRSHGLNEEVGAPATLSCRNPNKRRQHQPGPPSEIGHFDHTSPEANRLESEKYELDMFNLLRGHTISLNKNKPQTCQNSGTKQFVRFKPNNDLRDDQLKLPSINKNAAIVHLPNIFSPNHRQQQEQNFEQHNHSLFSDGNLSHYQPQSRRVGMRGNRNIPQSIHGVAQTKMSYLEPPRSRYPENAMNLSTDVYDKPPFPKSAQKYGNHKKSQHSVMPPDINFLEDSFNMGQLSQQVSPVKQGIVHKRDIKSSSRLPQAFRIYRSNNHQNKSNRLNNSQYNQ